METTLHPYPRPRRFKTGQILLASDLTDADLHRRIDWCGSPAPWGWNFCRTAGCHRCRKYRAMEWVSEAQELFRQSNGPDLRSLTIMLAPCASIESVPTEIVRGKRDLRNLMSRLRKSDHRAEGMRIFGCSETDWYAAQHVHLLSGYKRTQIESLGLDVCAREVWMPHLHLIVDLAGLPEHKLMNLVDRKWGGARQTYIQPFQDWRTQDENIKNLITYPTKSKHYYKINPYGNRMSYVQWNARALVEYYNMLNNRGGFSLIRFHLKPYRPATNDELVDQNDDNPCDEGLPFLHTISENSYPLIYN